MFEEILWTDERSEAHIARHCVSPHEIEDVLYTRPRVIERGRAETRYVFGTSGAGRHLMVVVADAMDGRIYVVTARDMTAVEKRNFRRKGR